MGRKRKDPMADQDAAATRSAKYVGDHDQTQTLGYTFPQGVFVEVSESAFTKLSGNSCFEVSENADSD